MPAPVMPPGLVAAPSDDPFAAARAAGEDGIGTLFWQADAATLRAAVAFAPEEKLALARRAVCLGVLALADALLVAAPPERPVRARWPATLLVDGGVVGGGQLAWPPAPEDAAPPWLAFGFALRLAWPATFDPGEAPGQTALVEEGFEATPVDLLESFARHLLFHADAFARDGFRPIATSYGKLLDPPGRLLETGELFQGKYPLAAKLLSPDWQAAA